jgi:hypothetical protein
LFLQKLTICSAELEMTVNMLIQIDKLVQLLESPVFTCTKSKFLHMREHKTDSYIKICVFNFSSQTAILTFTNVSMAS